VCAAKRKEGVRGRANEGMGAKCPERERESMSMGERSCADGGRGERARRPRDDAALVLDLRVRLLEHRRRDGPCTFADERRPRADEREQAGVCARRAEPEAARAKRRVLGGEGTVLGGREHDALQRGVRGGREQRGRPHGREHGPQRVQAGGNGQRGQQSGERGAGRRRELECERGGVLERW
jgi:hypothetical protein